MAIYTDNPSIYVFEKKCLQPSILLPPHIFQIISMNNPNNQSEFTFPSLPMMVPCEVLRLLKNCDIRVFIRDYFRYISNSKNASFICGKLHHQPSYETSRDSIGIGMYDTNTKKSKLGSLSCVKKHPSSRLKYIYIYIYMSSQMHKKHSYKTRT